MHKNILILDAETLCHQSLRHLLDNHQTRYQLVASPGEFQQQLRENRYWDTVVIYTYAPQFWDMLPDELILFFASIRRKLHGKATIIAVTGDEQQKKLLDPLVHKVLRKCCSRAEFIHALGIQPRFQNGYTLEVIHHLVCGILHVPPALVLTQTRERHVVTARQISMYLARAYTAHPLSIIGTYFGGRDHTTVKHSCDTVNDLLDTDDTYRGNLHHIEALLQRT